MQQPLETAEAEEERVNSNSHPSRRRHLLSVLRVLRPAYELRVVVVEEDAQDAEDEHGEGGDDGAAPSLHGSHKRLHLDGVLVVFYKIVLLFVRIQRRQLGR